MSEQKNTENKYQRGKIYKLVSNQTDKIYVGSTCQQYLSNRLADHRRHYKNYQSGKHFYMTSFELLGHGDVDIILIEDYPCDTKHALHSRERYWIESLNCVNKAIPTRSQKEYYQDNKIALIERNKQYFTNNREVGLQKRKQYYQANKVEILEKRNQKNICECGGKYTHVCRTKHLKTTKHKIHPTTKQ